MSQEIMVSKSELEYAFNQAQEIGLLPTESIFVSVGMYDVCIYNHSQRGLLFDALNTIKREFIIYPINTSIEC